jgi:hypothetical protein
MSVQAKNLKLEIDSWEDRSGGVLASDGLPRPFGYVNFTDGSRVGYARGADHELFQPRTNGGGKYQEVTVMHMRMAQAFLVEKGVFDA